MAAGDVRSRIVRHLRPISHHSSLGSSPSSSSMGGSCSRSTRGPAAPAPASPISRDTLETSLGAIGSPSAEQQLAALREQQRETQQLAEQLLGLIEASGVMRVPGSAGGTGGGANANSATGAKSDSGATVESVMSALRRVASAQHQQRGVDGAAADGASAPSLSPSLPVQSTDTLRTSKLNKMPQPTSPSPSSSSPQRKRFSDPPPEHVSHNAMYRRSSTIKSQLTGASVTNLSDGSGRLRCRSDVVTTEQEQEQAQAQERVLQQQLHEHLELHGHQHGGTPSPPLQVRHLEEVPSPPLASQASPRIALPSLQLKLGDGAEVTPARGSRLMPREPGSGGNRRRKSETAFSMWLDSLDPHASYASLSHSTMGSLLQVQGRVVPVPGSPRLRGRTKVLPVQAKLNRHTSDSDILRRPHHSALRRFQPGATNAVLVEDSPRPGVRRLSGSSISSSGSSPTALWDESNVAGKGKLEREGVTATAQSRRGSQSNPRRTSLSSVVELADEQSEEDGPCTSETHKDMSPAASPAVDSASPSSPLTQSDEGKDAHEDACQGADEVEDDNQDKGATEDSVDGLQAPIAITVPTSSQGGDERRTLLLNRNNATEYRRDEWVYAFKCSCAFSFNKSWGTTNGRVGDWIIYRPKRGTRGSGDSALRGSASAMPARAGLEQRSSDLSGDLSPKIEDASAGELLLCSDETFRRMYKPVEGKRHRYLLNGTVLARRMDVPFVAIETQKLNASPTASASALATKLSANSSKMPRTPAVTCNGAAARRSSSALGMEVEGEVRSQVMGEPGDFLVQETVSAAAAASEGVQPDPEAEAELVQWVCSAGEFRRSYISLGKSAVLASVRLREGAVVFSENFHEEEDAELSEGGDMSADIEDSLQDSDDADFNGDAEDRASVTSSPADGSISPSRMQMLRRTQMLRRVLAADQLDKWRFPVFALHRLSHAQPLLHVGIALFRRHGLLRADAKEAHEGATSAASSAAAPSAEDSTITVDESVLAQYLSTLERAYLPNPYHSSTHAADVSQTINSLMVATGMAGARRGSGSVTTPRLERVEVMALLLAGAMHDVAHPGTNNAFQVNAGADIAMRYNDHAVLENFHCATGFRLMTSSPGSDIMGSLSGPRTEALALRRNIIHLVLATDLASHREHLDHFKQAARACETDGLERLSTSVSSRLAVATMFIKCADISHPAKELSLHRRWTARCQREFSAQQALEEEMQLPISMKVEQTPQGEAKSQLGFIQFLVRPMFDEFFSFWQRALVTAKSTQLQESNKVTMLNKVGRTQSTGTIDNVDVNVSCVAASGDGKEPANLLRRRVSEAPSVMQQQQQPNVDFIRDMAANIDVALAFWEKQAKSGEDDKKVEDEDNNEEGKVCNTKNDKDADKGQKSNAQNKVKAEQTN